MQEAERLSAIVPKAPKVADDDGDLVGIGM